MNTVKQIRFVWKPIVFLLCLVPFALVLTDLFEITGTLGANPVEAMLDRFGNWSIRFMLIALAVTPLRKLTGRNWLTRFRRMLGLFAFFYVLMHFLVWLMLDRGLYFTPFAEVIPLVVEDIVERTFITIGFARISYSAGDGGYFNQRHAPAHGAQLAKIAQRRLRRRGARASGITGGRLRKARTTRFTTRLSWLCCCGLRIYWHFQKRQKHAKKSPA